MDSSQGGSKSFTILHFNDVYNLKEREKEPVGGAPRFITAASTFKNKNPLVLFSGDIFSPSKLGMIMKGKQMIPFFQNFKIDVSWVGNHDLDFGLERFMDLKKKSGHPWVLSNVFDTEKSKDDTKVPIANCLDHIILEHSDIKIGIIGLAESEWLNCIACMDEDEFEYEDFVNWANRWCPKLREQGCEVIIALTHMRIPNDKKLTEEVLDIDLVLGGHDHTSDKFNIKDTFMIKSGTDFREFSIIEMVIDANEEAMQNEPEDSAVNRDKKKITRHQKVLITKEYEQNHKLQAIIDEYSVELDKKLQKVAGASGVDLDARFSSIRTQETNIGNFVADAMKFVNKTDCVLLNSGSFRTDEIIPEGVLRWRDVDTLFPIQDEVVVVKILGKNLYNALENSLSELPKLEGRFPSISGIRIKFDSSKPAFERIQEMEINDEPFDESKYYTLTTKEYMRKGKDGFDALVESEILIDGEICLTVNAVLIHVLDLLTRKNKAWFSTKKYQVQEALKLFNNTEEDILSVDEKEEKLKYNYYKIYPKIDGRLTDINV